MPSIADATTEKSELSTQFQSDRKPQLQGLAPGLGQTTVPGTRFIGQKDRKPEAVLIIDDDLDMLSELRDGLEASGYVVYCMTDATRLDATASMMFDLVVCDLAMPGIDGFEIIRRLSMLEKKPELIIISGYGKEVLHSAAISATKAGLGVRASLQKPIDLGILSAVMCNRSSAKWSEAVIGNDKSFKEVRDAMRHALSKGTLPVMFQPKVSVDTLELAGMEILLDSEVPGLGHVLPPAQIQSLQDDESLGLMLVQHQVRCARQLIDCLPADGRPLAVNVNLSSQLAMMKDLASWFVAESEKLNSGRSRFVIELTEDDIQIGDARLHGALGRLRLAGYGLAMDDFGQKDSGLLQFADLPVTEVKIDAEFIRQSRSWPKAAEIVISIADMAHRVGVVVTCEGIETADDLRVARGAHADLAQGFLFSPKVLAQDFLSFASKNRSLSLDGK